MSVTSLAAMATVDELVAAARSPAGARVAARGGERLATQRARCWSTCGSTTQRAADGTIPGALVLSLNHLEWRLDPTSASRIPEATGTDVDVVLLCDEGYCSSLAAARLHDLGLTRATDMIGGFQAWRAAGLPVEH